MIRHPPANFELRSWRSRGPKCPYCQLETRVYTGDELHVAPRSNYAPALKKMKFAACIECRAWAPVQMNGLVPKTNKQGRVLTNGTIADQPTRKLRQRAYALRISLVSKIKTDLKINHIAKRYSKGEDDDLTAKAIRELGNAYLNDVGAPMPNINMLHQKGCESLISWLRSYRQHLEEDVSECT